jgi:hypothetical protein
MTAQCPNCNFHGSTVLASGERKCANCSRLWQAPFVYPALPSTSSVPYQGSTPGKKPALIIAGVVVALVLFGALAAFASGGQHDSLVPQPPRLEVSIYATATPEEAPAPKPVPPKLPQAELGKDHAEGSTSMQAWWLVEYVNTGEVTISFPKVTLQVEGPEDTYTKEFTSSVYSLPPGENAWLLLFAPVAYAGGEASFEVADLRPVTAAHAKFVRLKGKDYRVSSDDRPGMAKYSIITGTLSSTLERELAVSTIIVVGLDADDKPCAYASGYADERKLPKGGSVNFKITAGTYLATQPTRWIVHSWGSYRD